MSSTAALKYWDICDLNQRLRSEYRQHIGFAPRICLNFYRIMMQRLCNIQRKEPLCSMYGTGAEMQCRAIYHIWWNLQCKLCMAMCTCMAGLN